jgi:hypothetical protein
MRPFPPAALAALAATAVLAGAGAPPAAAADRPPLDPDGFSRLSDETTLSRWAHPESTAVARRSPSTAARRVGRLRLDTEDGLPEVYLALERYRDPGGGSWVKVRLPARPNGQTGWVPREALGALHRTRSALVIDRRTTTAVLRRSGRVIWSARVGVGKAATPTPAGRFYVRERLIPRPGSIYGALAFGTSAYAQVSDWPGGGVVGIHGTDQPQLIPGRPSHGCVRIRAADLARLGRLLRVGTPVRIL